MDIITHALAGAATGAFYGKPVIGAVVAIIPDLVLGIKRKEKPTELYNFTHSLLFVTAVGSISLATFSNLFLFWAVLSHVILDLMTHGKVWAPTLFYPHSKRFSYGEEWEWFNKDWWMGMAYSITWILLWLSL